MSVVGGKFSNNYIMVVAFLNYNCIGMFVPIWRIITLPKCKVQTIEFKCLQSEPQSFLHLSGAPVGST